MITPDGGGSQYFWETSKLLGASRQRAKARSFHREWTVDCIVASQKDCAWDRMAGNRGNRGLMAATAIERA
jgi:hypothetical protein